MTNNTRRRLIRLALIAPLLAVGAAHAQSVRGDEIFFVGTQGAGPGQGIFAARLDPDKGTLTAIGPVSDAPRPTWLVAHPRLPLLYSVSEIGNDGKSHGQVLTFSVNPSTGALTPAGAVDSGGAGPTHLALDAGARTMLVANFGTGHVAAMPVGADGTLAAPASSQQQVGSGPSPRQKSAHAHAVAFAPGGFALSPDLGADKLFVYRLDPATRALSAADPAAETVPAGTGPRHVAVHPTGKFVYLMGERVPQVRTYRWNAGRLKLVQVLGAVANPATADRARGAEIATSPDGRFVYASIRTEDVIAVYSVNAATGALREIQRLPSGGKIPWSFAIDPSGKNMLVAHQGSGTVTLLRRDPANGKLSATDQSIAVPKAVSLAYLTGKR